MATSTAAIPRRLAIQVALKPAVVLGGLVMLMLILRTVLAFRYMGGEVDWGAYLLSVKSAFGNEFTNADRLRPLLGPGFMLWPFTAWLGNENGLRVFSVLTSFSSILPMWLLGRKFLSEWLTVGVIAFFMLDLILAEMFVTGTLPIIGFSLITMVVWSLIGLAERWRWREAIVGIVSLVLIAHTNQTSSGLALIYIPIFAATMWAFSRNTPAFKRMFLVLAVGGLLALTALPWYGEVTPGGATLRFPGPLIAPGGPLSFDWWKAYAGFIVAGMTFWHSRKESAPILKAYAVLVVVMSVARMFSSHDEAIQNIFYRSQHLTAFFLYPLLGWLVWRVWWPSIKGFGRYYAVAAGIMVFAFMVWGFIHNVQYQSYYSLMASKDTFAAIDYINASSGTGAVSTNSNSLALYISALTGRKTTWVSIEAPPQAWEEFHFANLCLWDMSLTAEAARKRPCNRAAYVDKYNIEYVLIEKNWWYERQFWGPATVDVGRIYGIEGKPYPWERTEQAEWLEPVGTWGSVYLAKVRRE